MGRRRGSAIPNDVAHLGDESWATCTWAKRILEGGKWVSFVGRGSSMEPYIPDMTRCLIRPLKKDETIPKNAVVFCEIGAGQHRGFLLHRARAFKHDQRLVLIGNNHGYLDGWTTRDRIIGIYVGPVKERVTKR